MKKILIIEDEPNIRELVLYNLQANGYEGIQAEDGIMGITMVHTEKPDLILLDIMLPEEDGLSILKRLRENAKTKNLPVIMLTAKGTEYDKVRGFDAGADDYIPKPFGMMELLARVKALLRRTANESAVEEYQLGSLYVCPPKHQVRVDGQAVTLTLKEYQLLCLLLENQQVVLTRDQILNNVWGYSFSGESRTVDVHIRTLRQKLGSAGDLIQTVRGIGYMIAEGSHA